MDGGNCYVKKSPYRKEWMGPADPLKKASTVKKINGRLLLLYSNKMTHSFKELTTVRDVLKKMYCLYKNLILQTDLLNAAVPKNYSAPKEN